MDDSMKQRARSLLATFRGSRYVFGLQCMPRVGELTADLQAGARAAVVAGGAGKAWGRQLRVALTSSLKTAGVAISQPILDGVAPNAPRQDVFRIAQQLRDTRPDVIVAAGAGSVIDAVKAANALATLGDRYQDIEAYFGVGKVTEMLHETQRCLTPLVAVELAASSAAHLTKYANITDTSNWQKKLIIDDAVVPDRALFDYEWTRSMSRDFTADGALDGMSHCLEVFLGLKGAALERVTPVATTGIELIVKHLRCATSDGSDLAAREALGLGTDLGGQAIMIGGTSGAHLTSFSLVDILSHGRACALMNPYYIVFFAPAVEPQLRTIAGIFRSAGYLTRPTDHLHGRDLGLAVADAMINLSRTIGFPTRLRDVPGFTDQHIRRCLEAAKNPQLASKLQNMPVALSAQTVDEHMAPVLEAAAGGDFSLIENMRA